jgi:exonuclease VII small subunit
LCVRLESNRESARLSRERKKQYVIELEAYVMSLEQGRGDCEAAVRRLTAENQLLRTLHTDASVELKAVRSQLQQLLAQQPEQ